MRYKLGKRSLGNLAGVHPHLVAVVMLAITETEQDFSVRRGVGSLEEQQALVDSGASWTLDSDHLPRLVGLEPHPLGRAVDVYPYVKGSLDAWRDVARCRLIVDAHERAAKRLGVCIYSGGKRWGKDWYHIGLDRRYYRRRHGA